LKLAHQWEFVEVKDFALRELEKHHIPALEKIILYHTHDVNRNLLQEAYAALTVREQPLTIEEGRLLGLETALLLAQAREKARTPVFNSKQSGNSRSSIHLAGAEVDTLIKDLFQLSSPNSNRERPPTPQTPTGRGTPTSGGRNTPKLDIQTNGASPAHNSHRGGSVMRAYSSFSPHADLPEQRLPTGSTATQMEPPTAKSTAAPITGPMEDTGVVVRAHEGGGRVSLVPDGPESKGKAAAAAEASLDPVMLCTWTSVNEILMKKVVSDGHRSQSAITQARADIVETKETEEAQGVPSTSKISDKTGQGPARKSETAGQGSGTARLERSRTQSEQLATATSTQETRSGRSRSRTAEPTKKEQLQINTTTAPGPEPRKRDTTPTPTRGSAASSSASAAQTQRPVHNKKQHASTTSATSTSSGLFGFVTNFIGSGSGDPGYESSSRESEDDTPMAGGWRPRSRPDREAETRAKAQEATRLRLEAEAAKARAESEEQARKEAEEKIRKEAEERAHQEAEEETRREAEEEARREAEGKIRQEAAEEKARQEAEEKARKDDATRAKKMKLEARKAAKARKAEADAKAKEEADAKAKEEADAKAKADAEAKAKAEEHAKAKVAEAEKAKREAEAAEARAKAAEVEKAKREAEAAEREVKAKAAEAEKSKREAEAAEARAKAAEV
jgi:hypothetical protein